MLVRFQGIKNLSGGVCKEGKKTERKMNNEKRAHWTGWGDQSVKDLLLASASENVRREGEVT